LAHLPTPVEDATRFAKTVGGVRVLIKRDDCTGLLFGGNKVRSKAATCSSGGLAFNPITVV
jgi:1-aminocyclopropane-1-carboxylate deaminase/D-cysteine desulfhydrase-like pyridoxal-dependent ACC family enzyme